MATKRSTGKGSSVTGRGKLANTAMQLRRPVYWERPISSSRAVRVKLIEPFDARGKRLVYGRGDHFARRTLNMDVRLGGDGVLYARFWSRARNVDVYSYSVSGVAGPPGPRDRGASGLDER